MTDEQIKSIRERQSERRRESLAYESEVLKDIAALLAEVERLRGDLRFAAEWASASLGERHWEVEDNARLAAIFRDLGSEPT